MTKYMAFNQLTGKACSMPEYKNRCMELSEYCLNAISVDLRGIGFESHLLRPWIDYRTEFFFWCPKICDIQQSSDDHSLRAMARDRLGFIVFCEKGHDEPTLTTLIQNRETIRANSDLIEVCRVLSICS